MFSIAAVNIVYTWAEDLVHSSQGSLGVRS